MAASTSVRAGLTLAWAVALVGFIRFWEQTNLVPALAGWTCAYLVAYAATIAEVAGPAALRTRAEVGRLAVWAGIVVAVLMGTLLVPTVEIRDARVHTTLFVRVVDTALPLWITARVGVVLWKGSARVLALGGFAATFLLALWGLMVRMPGRSFAGTPAPLTEAQQALRDGLEADVRVLATDIGPRHYRRPAALADAAAYLERELGATGRDVASQPFVVNGQSFRNLEVVIPGTVLPEEIIVIGAHYDTWEGTPGADDNASGVAVLLALARAWRGMAFARTVKLVAFANEEPPFFETDGMGSRHYAARAAERGDRIVAMFSLETVGYFSDEPGSQAYPPPFSLFYPSAGDFIGFVGDLGSRPLVVRALAAFRRVAQIPSEGLAAPSSVPGVDWSDQQAFWRHGYLALMITDTAPFRYAQYHYATDTPDRLDYDSMARLTVGLYAMFGELAGSAPGRRATGYW